MARKRYSDEDVLRLLRDMELLLAEGNDVASACRSVGPVDLLLLHYPSINDEYEIEDYMAQFAAVHDAGLCRNIGVSNFTKAYIDKARELLGEKMLMTNQVELHVFLHNRPIVEHCASHNIRMTAYSPLARGAVLSDPTLKEIGKTVGGSASQVALAWLLAKGYIVIPSAGSSDRIRQNLLACELELNSEQMAEIGELNSDMRLVDGPWCPVWDT